MRNSFLKIQQSLSGEKNVETSTSNDFKVVQNIVITEPVEGDVKASSLCISNIPKNLSPENLAKITQHMGSVMTGGVEIKQAYTAPIKGTFYCGFGNMDFSSFGNENNEVSPSQKM